MRVVLDTNILISALMIQTGNPAAIYRAWREGYFTLLSSARSFWTNCAPRCASPAIAERIIKPYKAGGLVNEMKKLAESVEALPRVRRSPDLSDDFLLALCEAGRADYLVTGDKSGLLAHVERKGTQDRFPRAHLPHCSHERSGNLAGDSTTRTKRGKTILLQGGLQTGQSQNWPSLDRYPLCRASPWDMNVPGCTFL